MSGTLTIWNTDGGYSAIRGDIFGIHDGPIVIGVGTPEDHEYCRKWREEHPEFFPPKSYAIVESKQ